jgi:hypothetical protein
MKRLAFLAAVACLCSGVLPGTGRADFIYTFATTTAASFGGGSVSVTIDVSNAQVAMGSFDGMTISSLSFKLTGTSSPFFDFTDNMVSDLVGSVSVDSQTGAFTGLTPEISAASGLENVFIGSFPKPTGIQFQVTAETDEDSGTGEWTVSQTPEPASLTLLGLGVASIAGYAWRRRR